MLASPPKASVPPPISNPKGPARGTNAASGGWRRRRLFPASGSFDGDGVVIEQASREESLPETGPARSHLRSSVPEMPPRREHHRNASRIAGSDHFLVPLRPPRLDDRAPSRRYRRLGPVGEREERVGRHRGAVE